MKALEHALHLAELHDAELHIISVIEEFNLPFASQYELWASESRDEFISQVLEEMNSAMREVKREDIDITVETRIEEGRPAKVIKEIAEGENFDLIVIGATGIGRVQEFLLGSVSREILNTSKLPVLVVK